MKKKRFDKTKTRGAWPVLVTLGLAIFAIVAFPRPARGDEEARE